MSKINRRGRHHDASRFTLHAFLLTLFSLFVLWASSAQAHTIAVWDRVSGDVSTAGPNGDVDHYDVYLCLGAACATNSFTKVATVPQVAPPVPPAVKAEVQWPLPGNVSGRVKVRAVDKAGNESPDSNAVEFDRNPPPAPAVGVR